MEAREARPHLVARLWLRRVAPAAGATATKAPIPSTRRAVLAAQAAVQDTPLNPTQRMETEAQAQDTEAAAPQTPDPRQAVPQARAVQAAPQTMRDPQEQDWTPQILYLCFFAKALTTALHLVALDIAMFLTPLMEAAEVAAMAAKAEMADCDLAVEAVDSAATAAMADHTQAAEAADCSAQAEMALMALALMVNTAEAAVAVDPKAATAALVWLSSHTLSQVKEGAHELEDL